MDNIIKSGERIGWLSDMSFGGIIGNGALGCVNFNNCQVLSLLSNS